MKYIFLSLFIFSSLFTKAQPLTLEVLQVIYADSFNLDFLHADTVFLPDGSGVSYESSINIQGFDSNATIESASDFSAIGMIMEHSYLGDLNINIYCPDGQVLALKVYPGGSNTFLGEPIDNDTDLEPGLGYYYMFRDPATYEDMLTTSVDYTTLPEGSYLWEGDTNSLIGCPINGDWTLEVQDNLASDNGYIFNWQLFFDPAIVPDSLNNGSIILEIVGEGLIQTDTYVEWNNGVLGLVNDNLAPGEYTAWLKEDVTNIVLDSIHVFVGIGDYNTGINELESASLTIYPNPVEDKLNLVWEEENVDYLILNSKGQVLRQGVISNGINQFNISEFSSGIYFIQISSKNGVLVKPFIKR